MTYQIDLKSQKEITEPVYLTISLEDIVEGFNLEKSSSILYLDNDQISNNLQIRKWQKGDWFIPYGMKGKKKLSDYFSDNKFSLYDKENVWILCSGNDIVWIIGHRSDNRFKVTPTTTKIVKIELRSVY